MLGEEYGVASHRRLSAVVWRCRRSETSADEVLAMAADRLHALLGDVLPVVCGEMKARAELRLCEPPKCTLPSHLSLHMLFLPPFLTTLPTSKFTGTLYHSLLNGTVAMGHVLAEKRELRVARLVALDPAVLEPEIGSRLDD